MGHREKLLAELLRRTKKLEAKRPQLLIDAAHRRQMKHGPDYSHSGWWGPTNETQRKAIRRAMVQLIREGAIVTHCRGQRRVTNIKLTDTGRALAKQIKETNGT